jgi:hypothetical protein
LIFDDTIVKQYRADGFIIVSGVFSPDEMAMLDSEANRVFARDDLKVLSKSAASSSFLFLKPEKAAAVGG